MSLVFAKIFQLEQFHYSSSAGRILELEHISCTESAVTAGCPWFWHCLSQGWATGNLLHTSDDKYTDYVISLKEGESSFLTYKQADHIRVTSLDTNIQDMESNKIIVFVFKKQQ